MNQNKIKKNLNKCVKIIDEIKGQVLFITEANIFIMGRLFKRFKFKTVDDLPYNKKINVPVCVISIKSVFEQGWYYRQTVLQECFYENEN